MVPDLEDVDRRQEPARDERRLYRRLGVAGQQGREAAHPQEQHDRAVVDVALGKGRCRIGLARIQHLDRGRLPEPKGVSGAQDPNRYRGVVRIGHQAAVGDVGEGDARVENRADPEAVEHVHEPRDVVLVRVAEHEQVDAAGEEGQVPANASQGELRVRPPVDEHRGSIGGLDQNRVALADGEHRQMQQAVRLRRDRDDEQHSHQRSPDRRGPHDPSQDLGRGRAGRFEPGRRGPVADGPVGEGQHRQPGDRD